MKTSLPRLAALSSAVLLLLWLTPISMLHFPLLTRYVAGITAVLLIVRGQDRGKRLWIGIGLTLAILYNPIVPVVLGYPLQPLLNLASAGAFLIALRSLRL
ncbi:MAG: DUF6804 family protein [Acidobacteriota bacterium]